MGKQIFVFGSNLAGIHGAGSAREALDYWGAIPGKGIGLQGSSYAIPTKNFELNVLQLEDILIHVQDFIAYADEHPGLTFNVVKIGCGLAGFTEDQIAPMFAEAPGNVNLPDGWRKE